MTLARRRRLRGLPELRARLQRIPWWAWASGGVALFLLFFRKEAAVLSGRVVRSGQEALFALAIPLEARPYAGIILQVAREQGVDPFLLAAIGQRESRWGQALSPPGPGGTGDAGHGKGIMQIDDRSHLDWINSHNWRDPYVNVTKGAQVLKQKLAFLSGTSNVPGLVSNGVVTISATQAARRGVSSGNYPDPRPLSGDRLNQAAIAAYNTGEGNVLMSLAAGRAPDVTTANGNYGADVLAKLYSYAAKFTA